MGSINNISPPLSCVKQEGVFVGVDAGNSGAIVTLDSEGEMVDYIKTPLTEDDDTNRLEIAQYIHHVLEKEPIVFIEKVWAIRGQGVTSCFTFGGAYWAMRYAFAAAAPDVVAAMTWQKHYGLTAIQYPKDISAYKRKKIKKQRHIALAEELSGCEIEDDGVADAYLIALYGLNLYGGD